MGISHNTIHARGSSYETTVCTNKTREGITDQQTAATVTEANITYPNSGMDDNCIKRRTNWVDCRSEQT